MLERSALSLILLLQEIDEIWASLKAAYGHSKLLLKKKIAEMSKISQFWKLKDPDPVEALSHIINNMTELPKLGSEHGIESKLHTGNGIERVYQ